MTEMNWTDFRLHLTIRVFLQASNKINHPVYIAGKFKVRFKITCCIRLSRFDCILQSTPFAGAE
jgi:hypothetical protein